MAGLGLSAEFLAPARRGIGSLADALGRERDRWVLWIPPCIAAGIGLYFLLDFEPPLWWGAAAVAPALVVAAIFRRLPGGMAAAAALAVAAGFAAAELRTAHVAAPVLDRKLGPVRLVATIEAVSPTDDGAFRASLIDVHVPGLARGRTPARVRIRVRRGTAPLVPGASLAVRAILMPPPPPVSPGAFDFARRAFFQRIGAVGFAVGTAEVRPGADGGGWTVRANRLRQAVTGRILAALPGPEGAIAAALITGERAAIPEDVLTAIRAAGLAHLLAISGLHFALVAGLLFGGLRLALACIPWLALRYPIKKWAAVGALAGASGYLLLSGASVSAERAFLMLSVVLIAVLLDRQAISMRLVAVAATVILLAAPESLLSVSFQMSFAAVVALVAVYEAVGPHLGRLRGEAGPVRRIALFAAGIALTTLVAGIATAPFAIFHFNRFAVYGVLANLLAVPITGLWIMPWALAGMALMPFGLESWALAPMGWGISAMVAVARAVAAWPHAQVLVPAIPVLAAILASAGGLWLALWRGPMRLAGLAGLAAALVSAATVRAPDVLLGPGRGDAAVRLADGRLAIAPATRAFTRGEWLRRDAQREPAAWPGRRDAAPSPVLACDTLGCIYRRAATTVALVREREALAEDCFRAGVVVAPFRIRPWRCRGAGMVIDDIARRREGAQALWLEDGAVRRLTDRESRGARPWVAQYMRNSPTRRP